MTETRRPKIEVQCDPRVMVQHDAGEHLTHYPRLMYLQKSVSCHSAYRQNHGNLQDKSEHVKHQWSPLALA